MKRRLFSHMLNFVILLSFFLPIKEPVNIFHASTHKKLYSNLVNAQVDSRLPWQSSGVFVQANEIISLQVVDGQWTDWIGGVPYNNGTGWDYICTDYLPYDECVEPMPDERKGSLIGKIGNYLFAIGSGTSYTAQLGGELYMRINDDDNGLWDNDGILIVKIYTSANVTQYSAYMPLILSNSEATPIPTPSHSNTPSPNPTATATFIPTPTNTPTPSLTATLMPTPTPTEYSSRKVVFTIAFLDATPINDPDDHQLLLINYLRSASTWHGYDNPSGVPQLQYNTYGNAVIRINETPPYRADNGKFDYAAVYERFDLCNKIQAGLVDEVWIWESGSGNAWEWVTNGPKWSWVWDSNVPNCDRTITTLNLNYQREIDVALESFGHRLEGAFMTHFPCDFYTESWPWIGWPFKCTGLVSDQFGYVARPFSGNNYIGVCGDVHHPPNILDNREYVYNDMTTVQSICKDWQWDNSATISTFNCTEWGCTERGFLVWWMQNIPGLSNNNHDRNGNIMANWWEWLFW